MISRFFRHFREGAISLKRNFAMSLSSSAAVTVTLLLVSLFLILTVNIQEISHNISENLLIHVKIKNEIVLDSEILALQNRIRVLDNVRTVTFSSRDDELQRQLEAFPVLAEILKIRDENPLRNAFIVHIIDKEDIESTAKMIANLPGIETTEYGGQGVNQLIDILATIQRGSFVLVFSLSLLAIFLISNTIKVTIYARKEEISLMRMIGASNNFIRAPFMFEGMLIGLLGSIIPMVISAVLYYYFYNQFGGQFFSAIFKLTPIMPFLVYLLSILLIIGMFVGLLGSFVSVTRYLRWRR